MAMKKCARCTEKPLVEFGRDKRTKDGLQSTCRTCNAADKMRRYNAMSALEKKARSLRKYGLTTESYDLLLAEQAGRCAICKSTEPGGQWRNGTFFVDHCHISGGVRGLLCCTCNAGLGYFKDNPQLVWTAYQYLKEQL